MSVEPWKQHYTVGDHLAGRDAEIVALYRQFVGLIEDCGSFEYVIGKQAITFKGTRRLFAGVIPKAKALDGFLVLQYTLHDARIRRPRRITDRLYNNYFRVTAPEQLDEEFAGWVFEAFEVGQGAHLTA